MGSSIDLDEVKRYEVTEVYTHPDAKVDIVFVHGLNGDPRATWTSKEKGTFWPSQLLPVSLKSAQARILVYGYNADVYTFGNSKGGPSSDMIHQHAQTMLKNLTSERTSEEAEEHPIIFVAHSLGGILVKRALELSHDLQGKSDDALRSIYVSTYGIIFLGTPHNGADPAKWGIILQSMVDALIPRKLLSSHSQLVKTLQSNNETLQNINVKFLDIYRNHLKVCMVHEAHPTDLKGTKMLIVDQLSAGPLLPDVEYFGIEATHSGMCKFDSKNSPGYTNVSVTLKQWVQEAPSAVKRNWAEENEFRERRKAREMGILLDLDPSETQRPKTPVKNPTDPPRRSVDTNNNNNSSTIIIHPTVSISPETSEQDSPYFIKPSGFRPNSLFVGRESELALMHRMLFDKKRRAEGTSAVLIQSLPGGGKTHLAREYVYLHKDDFPGGIFWLRAKSDTELAAGYWEIACKAALKTMPSNHEEDASASSERFVTAVRKWFEKRHEWLLILDGIHFSHGLLRRFIPDSRNTSLIYTSTEKSVIGDHHFMNPQIIRLPLLSAREAQKLLLLELGRSEPFEKTDMKHSMELVQSMGFLPVVIHAVAQRLKATDEPLSKFAKSYSSEPRLRGLGTYTAVVDQLKEQGANEALNLIRIICFFSQHIPVEMISLGLRASDVVVKAREAVTGQSLNNTFKILNTFALIDRNEHDPPQHMHSSQSSKDSRDMLSDNIDVIRLHSVVQAFFVDTLHAEGTLPIWLDRAVRVFCCSYDIANERIARKHNTGRVEDYRLYEIHGKKLQEHLAKYNSRHVVRGPVEDSNIRPGISRRTSKHLTAEQKLLMVVAKRLLTERLSSIQKEIELRTSDVSEVIAGGNKSDFPCSIFDRTSSSSDTGPETPGSHDKFHSGVSTWGLEPDKGQLDSPESLTYDYLRRLDASDSNSKPHFPIPMPEDPGYDTDNDESVAMTIQPSQRTMRPEPGSEDFAGGSGSGGWEQVRQRRRTREEPPLHRTIKNLERTRYRDSAGAFRAMISSDPRVMRDTRSAVTSVIDHARGYVESQSQSQNMARSPRSQSQSRERMEMSSQLQSGAEVALSNITQAQIQSSPSPRRSSSSRPSPSPGGRYRMIAGSPSYAHAITTATPDIASSYKDPTRFNIPLEHSSQLPESRSSDSSYMDRPRSSAVESLQRFPVVTTMPPYPPSPSPERWGSEMDLAGGAYLRGDDNLRVGTGISANSNLALNANEDLYGYSQQQTIYPKLTGLPPIEHISSTSPVPPTQNQPPPLPPPLRRTNDDENSYSQTFSGTLPPTLNTYPSNGSSSFIMPDILSLSSPNIKLHGVNLNAGNGNGSTYHPGHPEFSGDGGYTSQPMSRDVSGGSTRSVYERGLAGGGGGYGNENENFGMDGSGGNGGSGYGVGRGRRDRVRRASVAETEPMPRLPNFSPRILPTSYQVYERMRERDLLRGGDGDGLGLDIEMDGEVGGERGERGENGIEVVEGLGNGSGNEARHGVGNGNYGGNGNGIVRKSPRLELARLALVERMDELGRVENEFGPFRPPPPLSQQQQKRAFNPTATSFSPNTNTNITNPNTNIDASASAYTNTTPPLPPLAPPNSLLSSISSLPPHPQSQSQSHSPTTPYPTWNTTYNSNPTPNYNPTYNPNSAYNANRKSPPSNHTPTFPYNISTPSSFSSPPSNFSTQNQNQNQFDTRSTISASPRLPTVSPRIPFVSPGGAEMDRTASSGSGGILIPDEGDGGAEGADINGGGNGNGSGSASRGKGKGRGRLISFGDYPEMVDMVEARERARISVLKAWRERVRVEEERRRMGK